jgi:hypothetical protein
MIKEVLITKIELDKRIDMKKEIKDESEHSHVDRYV